MKREVTSWIRRKQVVPAWCGLMLAVVLNGLLSLPGQAQGSNVVDDQVELYALQQLLAATDGAHWTNAQQNDRVWMGSPTGGGGSAPGPAGPVSNTDFSTWYGVTVVDGDVVGIDLHSNKLSGILPSELGNLTALKELQLADNE